MNVHDRYSVHRTGLEFKTNLQPGGAPPWRHTCWCIWDYVNGISLYNKGINDILVGGLEHDFYDCPFSWEFHHPN